MLSYYLLLLICFLGILVGTIIAHFAKSELEDGKKYFSLVKHMIFSIVLAVFFIFLKLPIWLSISLGIIFFIITYVLLKQTTDDFIFYAIYALILYETWQFTPITAILIFFNGIIVAALKFKNLKKSVIELSIHNLPFLVFGIILAI